MPIHDRQGLREAAAQSLSHAPDHRKIVLFSTGIAAGAVLLVSILGVILDAMIADAVGLQGLATRSMLSTIQTVLSLALQILLPFWGYGLIAAMLKYAREEPVTRRTLLDGLRRFGPVLRLMLLRSFLLCSVAVLVLQLVSPLLMLLPLAYPTIEFLNAHPDLLASATVDEATLLALLDVMKPLMLISAVVCLGVLAPLYYRFRMADLRIMDEPRCGALMALITSSKLMKRNRLNLLKLDLSFWWYYLALGALTVVTNGNLILDFCGVALPLSDDAVFLLTQVLGLGGQVALYYFARAHLETTYAKAYDTLNTPAEN